MLVLGLSSALHLSLLVQVQREPARLREHRGARGEGDHHGHVAAPTHHPPLPSIRFPLLRWAFPQRPSALASPGLRGPGLSTAPPPPDLLLFHPWDMFLSLWGCCPPGHCSSGRVWRCHLSCLVVTPPGCPKSQEGVDLFKTQRGSCWVPGTSPCSQLPSRELLMENLLFSPQFTLLFMTYTMHFNVRTNLPLCTYLPVSNKENCCL